MKKNPNNPFPMSIDYNRPIRAVQRELRIDRIWNRRHGIIDNHLCSKCDRIISGQRRTCIACIDQAVKEVFKEKRK